MTFAAQSSLNAGFASRKILRRTSALQVRTESIREMLCPSIFRLHFVKSRFKD
jgi:hypothetical protein